MIKVQRTTRLFAVLLASACALSAIAQDAPPKRTLRIFERDPFDRITLHADSGGGSYDVRPLEFPDRQLPVDPAPDSRLRVELIEQNTPAEIAWRDIAKVELFELMVLAEADSLVANKEFTRAYDYYAFLHAQYPKSPRLAESTQNYLYRNAGELFRQGEFRKAYALLDELHGRDPQHAGLTKALASVTDRIMQDLVRQEKFAAARRLLQYAFNRGGDNDATASAWRTKLQQAAAAQLAAAREHLSGKRYRQTRSAAQQAIDIWPTTDGAAELMDELRRLYPMVIVAAPPQQELGGVPIRLHPVAARHQRLTQRPLVTLEGYTSRGPRHRSPWGEVELASDRRHVDLHLQPTDGGPSLTAYDIASFVAATTDARNIHSVEVNRVYSARLHFARGFVSPLSQLAELAPASTRDDPRWIGDYTMAATDSETRFVLRTTTSPQVDPSIREIVEVPTIDPRADVDNLRRGRVDMLSRVPPSATQQLIADERFELRRYAMPSLHLLLPNVRRTYPANRTFRRAVAYAIDREGILKREILAGSESPDCQVISGPFPRSDNEDDFWGYAYDNNIAPLPHEPRMGLTLWRVATDELARAAAGANRPAPSPETIVIGHQDDWLHRRAAAAIVDQLSALGMTSRALPLENSDDLAKCDFVYVELLMREPVIDVVRLLEHGDFMSGSGYLALAVRELAGATNWRRQATDRLHKVHAAIHAEQTVIPLWQLADHFAFRKGLTGVADEPMTLYQDVQNWRLTQD